jgi:hypothetical protein
MRDYPSEYDEGFICGECENLVEDCICDCEQTHSVVTTFEGLFEEGYDQILYTGTKEECISKLQSGMYKNYIQKQFGVSIVNMVTRRFISHSI